MAKSRTGKTFFEVYGAQSYERDAPGEREAVAPGLPTYEDVIVISDIAERLHEPEPPRGKGRAAAIVAGSICGVGLAVGMFFLGRSLSRVETPQPEITARPPAVAPAPPRVKKKSAAAGAERRRTTERERTRKTTALPERPFTAAPKEKPPAKAAAAPAVAPPPKTKDTWTLRVISYTDVQRNIEKAATVADLLQSTTGHDAFVARLGDKLVVCVGEFDSKDSPELLKLQKFVRNFEYENKKQFTSSYPVRLK